MTTPTITHPTANWVAPVAHVLDALPGPGTFKNVIDLFLRYCWKPQNLEEQSPASRAYHTYLHEKTLAENILLLIPGLGILVKLIVLISQSSCFKDRNSETDLELYRAERSLRELQEANARAQIEREEELRLLDKRHDAERIINEKSREEAGRRMDEEYEQQMALIKKEEQRVIKFYEEANARLDGQMAEEDQSQFLDEERTKLNLHLEEGRHFQKQPLSLGERSEQRQQFPDTRAEKQHRVLEEEMIKLNPRYKNIEARPPRLTEAMRVLTFGLNH